MCLICQTKKRRQFVEILFKTKNIQLNRLRREYWAEKSVEAYFRSNHHSASCLCSQTNKRHVMQNSIDILLLFNTAGVSRNFFFFFHYFILCTTFRKEQRRKQTSKHSKIPKFIRHNQLLAIFLCSLIDGCFYSAVTFSLLSFIHMTPTSSILWPSQLNVLQRNCIAPAKSRFSTTISPHSFRTAHFSLLFIRIKMHFIDENYLFLNVSIAESHFVALILELHLQNTQRKTQININCRNFCDFSIRRAISQC